MAAGLEDFIKKNVADNTAGRLTQGFILFDVANLATSEHKLKSIVGILRDIVASKAVQGGFFAGLFLTMSRSIKALVHDTGSLEQALRKLSQIQTLRNMFAPLVGGAEAAKRKVAELVNFAATKKINLGDVAEAARQLQVSTKGGFSGARQLEQIADAAAATGNNMTSVSGAVAEFYDELQSGKEIKSAVEQLRQLGLVSEADAGKLNSLHDSGADASAVFATFTNTLSQFHAPAAATADDIDKVNKAFEDAKANLQEKFASPFVAADVTNTKNYTDAFNGIAPALEHVSGFLAILGRGFDTTKSSLAKMAGESKTVSAALETLVYVLGTIVSVGALIGGTALSTFLVTLGTGLAATGAAATVAATSFTASAAAVGTFAGGVAIAATGVGVLAAAVVIAVGVGIQVGQAFERSAKKIQEFQIAANQANEAIRKQIKDAQTLAQVQNAVAAATDRVIDATRELTKAREEGNPDKVAAAESALAIAEKNRRDAVKKSGGPGAVETQSLREQAQRELDAREQAFQQKLATAPPEQKSRLLGQRVATLTSKAAAGESGERARVAVEQESISATKSLEDAKGRLAIADAKAADAEKELSKAREVSNALFGASSGQADEAERNAAAATKERAKAQRELTAAQAKLNNLGANAPANSSVALERQSRLVAEGNAPDKAEKLKSLALQIERAKLIEGQRTQNTLEAQQLSADKAELDRQISLDNAKLKTEKEIANIKEDGFARSDKEMSMRLHLLDVEEAAEKARGENQDDQNLSRIDAQRAELTHQQKLARERRAMTRGEVQSELDMQQAQIANNTKQRQRLTDLNIFTQKFQELLSAGFEKPEAEKLAGQFSGNAISLNASKTELALAGATVADSLSRIGGGGGVYAPGGDAMMSALQRQNQLAEEANKYLALIAEADKGIQ